MPPTETTTDRSTTNNFSPSNKQLIFDLLKWVIGLAFVAAGIFYGTIFETKAHSDSTYVKKEVQDLVDKNNATQNYLMLQTLIRIEDKIDKHTTAHARVN